MVEDETGQDPKSPQDARLTSLDERLEQAQAEEAQEGKPNVERSPQRDPVGRNAAPVGPGRHFRLAVA